MKPRIAEKIFVKSTKTETEKIVTQTKTEKILTQSKTEKVFTQSKPEKVLTQSKTEKILPKTNTEKILPTTEKEDPSISAKLLDEKTCLENHNKVQIQHNLDNFVSSMTFLLLP